MFWILRKWLPWQRGARERTSFFVVSMQPGSGGPAGAAHRKGCPQVGRREGRGGRQTDRQSASDAGGVLSKLRIQSLNSKHRMRWTFLFPRPQLFSCLIQILANSTTATEMWRKGPRRPPHVPTTELSTEENPQTLNWTCKDGGDRGGHWTRAQASLFLCVAPTFSAQPFVGREGFPPRMWEWERRWKAGAWAG